MKDIRNILLGITFLFVGYFLAYKIHVETSEGLKAIIIQVSPIFPILLAFHFLGKSFDYHLRCFQIKNRRAIRKKELKIKKQNETK